MDQGQNSRGLINRARFDRHIGPTEAPCLSEYNFNVNISDIVFAISKIRDVAWPSPVQSDPSQRNHNLVCEFHCTHGHRTEDYQANNQFREREATKKNETDEPQHVIHMILGGIADPQEPMIKRTKISITREKRTRGYITEDALTFNDEYIKTLSQPHNDALVIYFPVNTFQIKCVLVDPASSANIIRPRVVEYLGLLDQIVLAYRVLNGFNMASKIIKGEITLPVFVVGTIQNAKFHVFERDMRYNALLRRPWIHCMRAVPSTLHQMMKFLTKDGIKTVYEEQHASNEMFAVHDVVPPPIPPPQRGPNKQTAK
ncbi:uncharacterized protein [Nicotiana sylvestris]|uniref:uncharacterized protein n=1 Tax=Nicotiana sylvestris TaxID=4096 RepID=UPI00388C4F33